MHTANLLRPLGCSTLALFLSMLGSVPVGAVTIWTGPPVTVTNAPTADPTLEVNQDRITDNVWLTRGNTRGLYNIRVESSFQFNHSPFDTEWALGSTANLSALSFDNFQAFVLGTVGRGNLLDLLDQNLVLHLLTDDIYIDLTLKDWGVAGAGGFSYERSTATVPEPGAQAMVGAMMLLICCGFLRRPAVTVYGI